MKFKNALPQDSSFAYFENSSAGNAIRAILRQTHLMNFETVSGTRDLGSAFLNSTIINFFNWFWVSRVSMVLLI